MRGRTEGSSSQRGLKWKGIGPKFNGLKIKREIIRWLEPKKGRIREEGMRESSRREALNTNLSILVAMNPRPAHLLDQVNILLEGLM
jgi:hypothetical protein